MKTKAFFSGLSLLIFLNLLIKPAWIFLIDRQVQNSVGHKVYGTYFALFNLTYVLLFIADAGITNMLTQRVAAGTAVNVMQSLRAKISLLILYTGICLFIGWITGVGEWRILFYLILIQSLSSLALFFRGLLSANQFFKTDAFFSVLDKTLMLLFCIGPVYGFFVRINIYLFLQLQLLAIAISLALLSWLSLRRGLLLSSTASQSVLGLIKNGSPFLLIVLLMAVHYRLDGFLLERLHTDGARQAGIYASAYRLLDAGNTAGYLCVSFLVPFVARNRGNGKVVEKAALLLRHVLLLIAVTAVSFVATFAPVLQQFLYHTNDAFNSRVIVLCVAVLPAYYLVHVYGSLLTAVALFQTFIRILIFSAAINIALNIFLIPIHGATGCCMAALTSQYICAGLLYLSTSQRLSLPHATRWFGVYAACGVACWLIFSSLKNPDRSVWIILAIACLVATVFAFTQKARLRRFIATINA